MTTDKFHWIEYMFTHQVLHLFSFQEDIINNDH